MTETRLGAPGLIGKHGSSREFLSLGNRGPEFSSFDTFLVEALEWAEARAGPGWPDAFSAGSVQAFIFHPGSERPGPVLVGALAPSWDGAGRRFPLCVALPLLPSKELQAAPHLLPLVVESCWQATGELASELVADPEANPAQRVLALQVLPVDLEEARLAYAEWTTSLSARDLWALIWDASARLDPGLLLGLIAETMRSGRGGQTPQVPLCLRLPLGAAGGAAVCFWLDWVRRLARWTRKIPSFFWTHDGRQGTMLLCLASPPRSVLAELWLPTGRREEICDLVKGEQALALAPETTAFWRRLWQDEDGRGASGRTVAELLESVESCRP